MALLLLLYGQLLRSISRLCVLSPGSRTEAPPDGDYRGSTQTGFGFSLKDISAGLTCGRRRIQRPGREGRKLWPRWQDFRLYYLPGHVFRYVDAVFEPMGNQSSGCRSARPAESDLVNLLCWPSFENFRSPIRYGLSHPRRQWRSQEVGHQSSSGSVWHVQHFAVGVPFDNLTQPTQTRSFRWVVFHAPCNGVP